MSKHLFAWHRPLCHTLVHPLNYQLKIRICGPPIVLLTGQAQQKLLEFSKVGLIKILCNNSCVIMLFSVTICVV